MKNTNEVKLLRFWMLGDEGEVLVGHKFQVSDSGGWW